MRRILKEPLIHFLLGGALLFVLFAATRRERSVRPDEIVVTAARVEVLSRAWARTWQRPPTRDELDRIVAEHVREEIYYREALALGMERDDSIIRRRLRQKMEFLAEDFVEVGDPGDGELQAFIEADPERFRKPAVLTFRHIYFSPDQRGDAARADAERVLTELTSATEPVDVESLGDPFFLRSAFDASSEIEIARVFGREFVPKLLALTPGQWSGPLLSGFGYHLVHVARRVEGGVPALNEIRDSVLGEWQLDERDKVAEEFYDRLRARYTVSVEMPPASGQIDPEQAAAQ